MANAAADNIALINALMGIPQKLMGSSQTVTQRGGTSSQTQTQTDQTAMSQEAVNAMLKSLMEGTSGRPGLAAVSGSQRPFGLYNTSSRSLLTNDLMARSAAEVEKARAPKTSTVTTTSSKEPGETITRTPGMIGKGGMNPLLLLGAAALGNKGVRDKVKGLFSSGTDGASGNLIASTYGDMTTPNDAIGQFIGNPDPNYFSDLFQGAGDTSRTVSLGEMLGNMAGAGNDFFSWMPDTGGDGIANLGIDQIGALGDFFSAGSGIANAGLDFGFLGGSGVADIGGFDFGGVPIGSTLNLLSGNNTEGAAGEDAVLGTLGAALGSVVPGVGTALGGFVGSIANDIPVVSDVVDFVGDIVDDLCFITTAICKLHHKPDDCYELTMMRRFRDEFVKKKYPEAVDDYYATAPGIVAAIEARDDANVIWQGFYRTYIVPAVEFASRERYEEAYTIYTRMVDTAKEIARG